MDAMLEMATLIGDRIAERMEARYQIMPMLTLDQAAKALDISIEKMRQLCNDGKIPFIRMDRLYRIKPADVNEYLEKNYCRPVSAAREIAEILREELALSPKKRNSPKKSANEKDKEGE